MGVEGVQLCNPFRRWADASSTLSFAAVTLTFAAATLTFATATAAVVTLFDHLTPAALATPVASDAATLSDRPALTPAASSRSA